MGFITIKCPSCGASIDLDDSREFGFCTYCGTKIIQDKIIVEHRGIIKIDGSVTTESLLERAHIMLCDGDFAKADTYFDRVLDIDPHCAAAYFGKEMCYIRVRSEEGLSFYTRSILMDKLYLKALQYSVGDEHQKYSDLGNTTCVNQQELLKREKEKEYQAQKMKCKAAYLQAKKTLIRRLVVFAVIVLIFVFLVLRPHDLGLLSAFGPYIGIAISVFVAIPLLCISVGEIKIIRLYRKKEVFDIPSTFSIPFTFK